MAGSFKKSTALALAILFVGSSFATAGGITTFQRPRAQSGRYKSRSNYNQQTTAKMQSRNSSIVEEEPQTPIEEAPRAKATSKSAKTGDKPVAGATGKTAMKAIEASSR